MTPERLRTIRRLALSGVLLVTCVLLFMIWGAWLLVIEMQAVAQGGDSTISRVAWEVWADQPWIVLVVTSLLFLASHVPAAVFWFLLGHFFAQSKRVYARVREEA